MFFLSILYLRKKVKRAMIVLLRGIFCHFVSVSSIFWRKLLPEMNTEIDESLDTP